MIVKVNTVDKDMVATNHFYEGNVVSIKVDSFQSYLNDISTPDGCIGCFTIGDSEDKPPESIYARLYIDDNIVFVLRGTIYVMNKHGKTIDMIRIA